MYTAKKDKAADHDVNIGKTVAEKPYDIEEVNRKLAESESQFGRGIEEAPVPIIIHADDGEILKISNALAEITGYTLEDIPTIRAWAEKAYGAGKEEVEKTVKALYSLNGSQYDGVFSVKTKLGDLRNWEFYSAKIGNLADGRNLIMSVAMDITVRTKLEEQLSREKNLLEITLSSVGDGVISCDRNGKIIFFNRVAEDLTGWKFEDVKGRKIEDVFNIVDEFTREKRESIIKKVIESKNKNELAENTILISKDGIERPIEDSAAPIIEENGEIGGVVLVFRDFSAKKQKLNQIQYLSYHDQLTGLYNRRFYEEELRRLDTERNLPLTIIMGDINGLKLINDSFGHGMGDDLLKKSAQAIKAGCREDDIVARLGGDEFVVLLPKTDAPMAENVINRIKEVMETNKMGAIDISISFGFETKREKDDDINEIFKKAEDHMYQDKLFEGPNMRNRTISAILDKLQEKNIIDQNHAERVSQLSESMGKAIGLNEEKIKILKKLGLLHDIGEIAIEKDILEKEGDLTKSEREEINRHPEIGYRILSTVKDLTEIAEYVLYHHERWNGKGYPKGLKAEEIPIEARIIAIADAYEAMTSDRSYRAALPFKVVIEELEKKEAHTSKRQRDYPKEVFFVCRHLREMINNHFRFRLFIIDYWSRCIPFFNYI